MVTIWSQVFEWEIRFEGDRLITENRTIPPAAPSLNHRGWLRGMGMKPFDENYDIDDFISGVELLKKWKIDKFALFHYIRKDQEKLLPKP